ncbi:MAG: SurA N-terminal domain-containing protein [Myxococcota bacterium]
MSLLERMRSGSDSTFMQVIMAMIIVAFVGVYAQTQGDRSGVVATVNGVKIMDTELSRAYRNALYSAEQRSNRTLSDVEQKQLSEQVRQDLIEQEVLLQEAHRLGLEVSYGDVARELMNLPFRDKQGDFDEKAYQSYLKRQQLTRSDYETKLHDALLRSKLQELVYIGASMSEPAMREAYVESETRVDLKVVRIRPTSFEPEVQITPEERQAWLAENESLVQETYEQDKDRLYDHPEQVRLRMIRLVVRSDKPGLPELRAELEQVRQQIDAGADMAELAKRWSEDPSAIDGGDLGLRPVAQLSAEDTNAIKSVPAGGLTKVVVTNRDARLIRIEERVEPKIDTLDEVRDSIADRLIRAERLPVMAATFAEEQLLPKWKESGEVPQDLLDAHGLTVADTGPIPTTASGNPFAPPQRLLDAARTAEVGSVVDEVFEDNGVYYVAQLVERTEPDLTKLDEGAREIEEQMLLKRRNAFYTAWVGDLKSRATIK